MANMRLAMDSTFWGLDVSSPQTLDGSAKRIPGEPFPLDGAKASRVLRAQQLSFLSNGFPLGIIPSYSPASQKELGSFSIQSLLLRPSTSNWWLGLIGQFRPKKLITSIASELFANSEFELPAIKDIAKHFVDKSMYSLGLCTQLSIGPDSSLLLSTEKQGDRNNKPRSKAKIYHKLPDHDITMEAAWPELFVDRNGGYWNVPESLSLDLSSLVSESGLRYRLGLQKVSGQPQPLNDSIGEPPLNLMPGLCAQAGFSYEKSRDIWRQKETQEDLTRKTDRGDFWWPSYDVCLKEPHATVSGIIGGTCTAWLTGKGSSVAEDLSVQVGESGIASLRPKIRKPLNADLYGSVCYTIQHGKFRKSYGDLTRVDARLDICSASAFTKGAANLVSNVFRSSSANKEVNPLSSPRLNLILQQQVAGPIVFRVDSKFSLGSTESGGKKGPHMEDMIFSLNYSLRLLHSGKVVAWYSPKRKEGMIELRLFEF